MKADFVIPGKNVNLRTTIPTDIDDYRRWNDPTLKAWEFDGPWYNENDISGMIISRQRWLESDHRPPYRHLEVETADGVHLGWVVVYYNENDPHMTEFGIDLPEEKSWGRGLGTEACYLWIDYLFAARDLTRIGFSTWSGNPAIINIGKKLGFIEEARIRRGCQVKGKFHDRIKMGILKEEWDRHKETFCIISEPPSA